MMNEFSKYPLNQKYLVAVSGGPDSMALLHKLLINNFQVIVCFVNYHHRVNSNDEEIMIKEFCTKNKCQLEIHSCFYEEKFGNFENWARVERYEFFYKVGKKYQIKHCFVGHHLDDVLETYLMQKQRGYISFYGLKENTIIKNVNIIRPLLGYTKQQLQEYCKENDIVYSYDYTNEDVSLLRNKIRHKILSNFTYQDKLSLLEEINLKNKEIEEIYKKIESIDTNVLSLEIFNTLKEEEQDRLLYLYINKHININLSKKRLLEIRKQLLSLTGNKKIILNKECYLVKEYNCLNVVKENMFNYCMVVNEPSIVENEYIKFDLMSDPSYFYIKKDSFPLTIRNVEKNKKIKIGKIHKSINRILIDEKIPYTKRLYWPEIVNNKGEIIFVPRTSQDKNNLFIVKELKSVL